MARISVPKGKGQYHAMLAAFHKAGATEFCRECYSWVLPGHSECSDWRALGLARPEPTTYAVVLEGGLVAEDIETAEHVTAETA